MELSCRLLSAKRVVYLHFRKIYTHVGSSCTSIIVLLSIVTTELKLNFFLENPFAKGQLKSWYDFFLKIRKLYAYASLLITSYYDQVLMKSTGVNISPVQRGNKGLWSFFVLVICQNPGVLPYTKEL